MGFSINLLEYQSKVLFQEVSDYKSFMKIELKLLEYLLTFWHGNTELKPPYLYVDDKNLHRAFLVNQDGHKIITIGFQFAVKTVLWDSNDTANRISHLNLLGENGRVTLRNVSEANSILASLPEKNSGSYYEANISESIQDDSFRLFEYLLFTEPGYVRYDDDIRGFKPNIHPRYHLDVNFTPNISYKIGLRAKSCLEDIINAIDRHKTCPIIDLSPQDYDACLLKYSRKKSKRRNKV